LDGQNYKEATINLSSLYRRQGRYQEAIDLLLNSPLLEKSFLVNKQLAHIYYDVKDLENAEKYYLKSLEINPDAVNVYNQLGNIYNDRGDYRKSMEYFKKDTKSSAAVFNQGLFYSRLKNHRRATHYYRKALELNPKYFEAFNNIGLSYRYIKKYSAGMSYINKGLREFPDNYSLLVIKGDLYMAQRKHAEALEQYQKVMEITPNYYLPYSNLAGYFIVEKNKSEALKYAMLGYERGIRDIELLANLVSALYMNNRFEEAIRIGEEGLAENKSIDMMIRLAMVYSVVGNNGKVFELANEARKDNFFHSIALLGYASYAKLKRLRLLF
jgi:tetratricopeptide (TPR) repeat protein